MAVAGLLDEPAPDFTQLDSATPETVTRCIFQLIRGGQTDDLAGRVAAGFGVSLRSYQRSLARIGVTHTDLRDQARLLSAVEQLRDDRRSVTAVALDLGYAHAGVRPEVMGIGPIPAVRNLFEKTGLSAGDFDVIESNEAFAAQAIAVNRELGLDVAKVNPNGGAIALGHPVGATGAIITVKALYELERIGGKRGLITMCIGGGQGIAVAIERL